jgi:type IV secretion system protein TrbL
MVGKTFIAATLLTAATAFQPQLQVRDAVSDAMASASAAIASATAAAAACSIPSSILDILSTAPTPSPDVLSALTAAADRCHFTCAAGAGQADCSSYTSAASKWAQSNSKAIEDFYSTYTKTCTQASAPAVCTGASGAAATGTAAAASGTGSSSGASSTSQSGAARGQDSFTVAAIAGVAAAIGVLAIAL